MQKHTKLSENRLVQFGPLGPLGELAKSPESSDAAPKAPKISPDAPAPKPEAIKDELIQKIA